MQRMQEAGQDGQLTDGTAGENVSKKEHAGGSRAMKDSLNLNPKVLGRMAVSLERSWILRSGMIPE